MAKSRTKIVRKILTMLGYDLRRLQKTHIHASTPGWQLPHDKGFDGFETIIPRPVTHFDIVFRSCTRVEIFGQDRKRLLDQSKSEVMNRCLNSLIRSIDTAMLQGVDIPIRLVVLDDHSAEPFVAQIKTLLTHAPCETEFIALETTGNGPSVGEAYKWARKNSKDVIYFVEDDYLHEPNAIFEIIRSYERHAAVLGQDVTLFPTDMPDRYRHIEETQVFLGSHRHWRTIGNTTFTSITSIKILNAHWKSFIGLAQYGIDPEITEANTLQHIYKQVPCLSPMPSLALHYQQVDGLSPFTDWKKWWADAKTDPASSSDKSGSA